MLVQDIGEKGLLAKLQRFCPPEIIGDDAAVMKIPPEESLIVTTDMLIDGVHFSHHTTTPADAGWRAAAANLSDLAAMGATPWGITVGLGLPGNVRVSWVEQLYQGMTECLQQYNTPIVGGDIVRSPVTTLAITAFGSAHPNWIIRRSTAQVGDAIVVTGAHGASRGGLELLLHPETGEYLSLGEKDRLIRAHQRPNPRLDVLPLLQRILFSTSSTLTTPLSIAGMDSSDGLADAVLQICHASHVGAIVDYDKVPIPSAFNHWLTAEKSLDYVLYGGEDFELVLCLPDILACALVEQLGGDTAVIGTIQQDTKVILRDQQNRFPQHSLNWHQGFQHFSSDNRN